VNFWIVVKTKLGEFIFIFKIFPKNGKIIAKVLETINGKNMVKCTTKNICQSICQVNKK
jgi:hypothetical protein